jgi:hypothetical protein
MSKIREDKIKKLAAEKIRIGLEGDPTFIAFYLKKYSEIEKKNLDQMISILGADLESYEKVVFFKFSDKQKIVEICDLAAKQLKIESDKLLSVIRHVLSIEAITSMPNESNENPGLLMAARKKENEEK